MSAFTLIATPLLIGFQIWLYGLPEHGTTMNPLLLPVFDIETVRQTINTSSHEVITSGVGENLVEAAEGATSELSRPPEEREREAQPIN